MVSKNKKNGLFVLWILLVPSTFYIIYQLYPPALEDLFSVDVWLFIALLCIISFFPIFINGFPIFLIEAITLAIFLRYGLFIEMIASQIGMLTLLAKLRIKKDEFFRIPMNSLMFMMISLASGMAYYLVGGQHGNINLFETNIVILVIFYQTIMYVMNQVCTHIIDLYVYKRKMEWLGKDTIFDVVSGMIVFPTGLLLYSTYMDMGKLAIVIVGIPLVSLTLILRLYYHTNKINHDLRKAGAIGHKLAGQLDQNQVVHLFAEEIKDMFQADEIFIYAVEAKQNKNRLHLLKSISSNETNEEMDDLFAVVWEFKKSILIRSSWQSKKSYGYKLTNQAGSALVVPVFKGEKIEGVVLLLSRRASAFEENQLMIADILCSYLATALENARHYEVTKEKSERCSLTKLYNAYYLDDYLKSQFTSMSEGKMSTLTLILIDLDHFKKINDSFGHLSGNEVLVQVAQRLSELAQYKGIAARYGGEEFVLILPNVGREEGYQFAELVRRTIGNRSFHLKEDVTFERRQLPINVTASIGVATAPFDAEDPHALLRHADRAMYTGAKRAGRNKVAQYVR